MDDKVESVAQAALMRAVAARASRCMGVFASDRGANQFSGVFVEDNGRHFIATASHCLDEIEDRTSLVAATFMNKSPGIGISGKAARYPAEVGFEIPSLDVGVIEIAQDVTIDLGVKCVQLDDMTSTNTGSGALVALAGFPWQLVKHHAGPPTILDPTPFVFFSEVARRSPEPMEIRTPIDPAIDVFVEYEKGNLFDSGGSPIDIKPSGMSGCGVFVIPRPREGDIWSPHAIELAGIQSGFMPQSDLLRVKRIEYVQFLVQDIASKNEAPPHADDAPRRR